MKGLQRVPEILKLQQKDVEQDEVASLCSLKAGSGTFGIDTVKIREVLGLRALQTVPLAPACIGGIVPYRGEVLTVISLRALLGLGPTVGTSCLLVLDEDEESGQFGLMVDSVGGVVTVERKMFTANPSTLNEGSRALFSGAYRRSEGLLVQLDPEKMKPGRLSEAATFRRLTAVTDGQSLRGEA